MSRDRRDVPIARRFSLFQIAYVYFEQKDYDRAYQFAVKASQQPVQRSVDRAVTYDLLGKIALEKDDLDQVLPLFEKALKLRQKHYQSSQQSHPAIAASYEKFGLFYSRQGQYSQALEWFEKAVDIYGQHYIPSHPSIVKLHEQIDLLKRKLKSVRGKSAVH